MSQRRVQPKISIYHFKLTQMNANRTMVCSTTDVGEPWLLAVTGNVRQGLATSDFPGEQLMATAIRLGKKG